MKLIKFYLNLHLITQTLRKNVAVKSNVFAKPNIKSVCKTSVLKVFVTFVLTSVGFYFWKIIDLPLGFRLNSMFVSCQIPIFFFFLMFGAKIWSEIFKPNT